MKKYIICLLLFVAVSAACLTAGYMITRNYDREEAKGVTATELQSETVVEDRIAANQEKVSHEAVTVAEEYYLVAEDGFLLVFLKDRKTIYLYIPYPDYGLPGEGAGEAHGRDLVPFDDGCVQLSGILYQLRTDSSCKTALKSLQ